MYINLTFAMFQFIVVLVRTVNYSVQRRVPMEGSTGGRTGGSSETREYHLHRTPVFPPFLEKIASYYAPS